MFQNLHAKYLPEMKKQGVINIQLIFMIIRFKNNIEFGVFSHKVSWTDSNNQPINEDGIECYGD